MTASPSVMSSTARSTPRSCGLIADVLRLESTICAARSRLGRHGCRLFPVGPAGDRDDRTRSLCRRATARRLRGGLQGGLLSLAAPALRDLATGAVVCLSAGVRDAGAGGCAAVAARWQGAPSVRRSSNSCVASPCSTPATEARRRHGTTARGLRGRGRDGGGRRHHLARPGAVLHAAARADAPGWLAGGGCASLARGGPSRPSCGRESLSTWDRVPPSGWAGSASWREMAARRPIERARYTTECRRRGSPYVMVQPWMSR